MSRVVEPYDEDLLEDDVRSRPGRLTLALAAGIVLAGAFGAGVLVQKHFGGTGVTTGAATAGNGFSRAGEGFTRGSFPGSAAGGAGAAAGGAGAAAGGAGAAAGGAGTSSTPVVVGTVVKASGRTITVKNFGGTKVTVTVPDGASVTTSSSVSKLTAGTTVSVAGSKASDGSVTASSVTARKK